MSTTDTEGPHTAGTVCPQPGCGQHHTERSAAAHNDGTAPVDVTAQLLGETSYEVIQLPAVRAVKLIAPAGLDEIAIVLGARSTAVSHSGVPLIRDDDRPVATLAPDAQLVIDASCCIVLATPERRITVGSVDGWREQLAEARVFAQIYAEGAAGDADGD